MNDLDITCFLSLVRTKNFLITARELSITQQVLSRKIAKLEEEIGFPLFIKKYHSVQLTQAGKRFHELFSRMERDLAAASVLSDDRDNVLHIACCQWLSGDKPVIDCLLEFQKTYPHITLNMTGGTGPELKAMIESGEIDLAITTKYFSRHIDVPYLCDELYELPIYLVLAEDHPVRNQVMMPELLQALPFLVAPACGESEDELRVRIRLECAKMDFMPRIITIYPNLESVYLELHMGGGISFLPRAKNKGAALSYLPMPRTATVVAVTPQIGRSIKANLLVNFFTQWLTDCIEESDILT